MQPSGKTQPLIKRDMTKSVTPVASLNHAALISKKRNDRSLTVREAYGKRNWFLFTIADIGNSNC